ncbi:hypothetical protein [Haliscomenobacter sp.]|uniref:hypothetical protein n=1 Tax=Haliscomenobacter sp. TaxID=2717303 RepID=UPI003594179A
MKNKIKPSVDALSHLKLFFLLGLVTIFTTQCAFLEKLFKKPSTITFSEPVKAPVAIALIDANRFLNTAIHKAKITLIDPGGKVVTANGIPFSTIYIEGGVMDLALKQDAVYDVQRPYRFTIKVEADGYSSNLQNILVTSDKGQYVPIFLAKLEEPPVGVATVVDSVDLTNGLLGTAREIIPKKSNGISVENIKLEVQKGTQFIYCNQDPSKKRTPKELKYRVLYASPRSLAASRTFPGGALITDAIGIDGSRVAEPSSPIFFESQGWMTIEMDADGEEISGFSKPVNITMPVSDSLRHPTKNRFIRAGDTLITWSLNNVGEWREEGISIIEGAPRSLVAKFQITHLSTWNLDYKLDVCGNGATTARINYTNQQAVFNQAYTELLNSAGTALRNTRLDYMQGIGFHTIRNFPDAGNFSLRVYQNGPGTPEIATSTSFSCAQATPSASMTIPGGGNTTIEIRIAVRTTNMGDIPLCNHTVWYRPCSSCTASTNACNSTNGFQFGGILDEEADPNYGRVIITKPTTTSIFDIHCIRIWQAENISGTPTQVAIDIPLDFLNLPATNPTAIQGVTKTIYSPTASTGTAPSITYENLNPTGGTPTFLFIIDGASFTMTPCR